MVTINGAKLGLKGNEVGSIEPKKHADLVVLRQNPFDAPQSRIKDLEVMMTFVAGKIEYKR
jgi:predicted amidohydrolase YtcJ